MYNMKVTVGYMPKGRVIGLSKIALIADAVSRRFQIQERIGTDIRDIMKKVTGSDDVAVLIDGEHSCMTARGIIPGKDDYGYFQEIHRARRQARLRTRIGCALL